MLGMKARIIPYVTRNKLIVDAKGQFWFQGHGYTKGQVSANVQ